MSVPQLRANCIGFCVRDCEEAHCTLLLSSDCVVVRALCTIASARLFGLEPAACFSSLIFKSFNDCKHEDFGTGDGVFVCDSNNGDGDR